MFLFNFQVCIFYSIPTRFLWIHQKFYILYPNKPHKSKPLPVMSPGSKKNPLLIILVCKITKIKFLKVLLYRDSSSPLKLMKEEIWRHFFHLPELLLNQNNTSNTQSSYNRLTWEEYHNYNWRDTWTECTENFEIYLQNYYSCHPYFCRKISGHGYSNTFESYGSFCSWRNSLRNFFSDLITMCFSSLAQVMAKSFK